MKSTLPLLALVASLMACQPGTEPGTSLDTIDGGNPDGSPDTMATPSCGDGLCLGEESTLTCPADCGAGQPICGNGVCDGNETAQNCATDCTSTPPSPNCGDGLCLGDENNANCPQDCGEPPPPAPKCGDGICNGTEDTANCAEDCGNAPPITGPNANITGWIDSVTNEGNGLTINGWTCHLGQSASIEVQIYVGGPVNEGVFVKATTANAENEQAVNDACQAAGSHRYHIPLSPEEITKHAGKLIHAYGVSL